MKSRRGFLGSVSFLVMLPLAFFFQIVFGNGAEAIIHLACSVGFIFISTSVFDFKIPKWISWVGCLSASILALIFLLQGVSNLLPNESLANLAFQILGQRVEAWLVYLLIFWFVMILLIDSRGKTKILGLLVISIVIGLEVYSFILAYLGTSLDAKAPILKVLYLLLFVWLLFESKKNRSYAVEKIIHRDGQDREG